ncbi:MAG: DUF4082 domain-containing protein [Bacteroidia bacterium]|nr:DUF4082 domain-containing protein [Bacteroidia bacterium]
MKSNYICVLVLLICQTIGPKVVGATFLNSVPSNKGTTLKSDATLGYAFRVGSAAVNVFKLGLWDQGADGLNESHQIGIWNISGELLVSTTVAAGNSGELSGNFRYATLLESIQLDAETVYIIAARYYNIDNSDAYITGTYSLGSGLGWDVSKDRYSIDYAGFVYPVFSDGGAANIGPNLQYDLVPQSVPEPDTSILLVSGGALLAFLRHQDRGVSQEVLGRKKTPQNGEPQ